MLGLALLFVLFLVMIIIVITSLGEERAGLCVSRVFVCLLCTCCFLYTNPCYNEVDKKAMIRTRYNRIPYPTLNTKWERDTYSQDGTKLKTAQVKSQGGSCFPTDVHKAILNKLNSKSKTNRKRRTLTIKINHNRSIALERSVINY